MSDDFGSDIFDFSEKETSRRHGKIKKGIDNEEDEEEDFNAKLKRKILESVPPPNPLFPKSVLPIEPVKSGLPLRFV
jgi:hypothetical protein